MSEETLNDVLQLRSKCFNFRPVSNFNTIICPNFQDDGISGIPERPSSTIEGEADVLDLSKNVSIRKEYIRDGVLRADLNSETFHKPMDLSMPKTNKKGIKITKQQTFDDSQYVNSCFSLPNLARKLFHNSTPFTSTTIVNCVHASSTISVPMTYTKSKLFDLSFTSIHKNDENRHATYVYGEQSKKTTLEIEISNITKCNGNKSKANNLDKTCKKPEDVCHLVDRNAPTTGLIEYRENISPVLNEKNKLKLFPYNDKQWSFPLENRMLKTVDTSPTSTNESNRDDITVNIAADSSDYVNYPPVFSIGINYDNTNQSPSDILNEMDESIIGGKTSAESVLLESNRSDQFATSNIFSKLANIMTPIISTSAMIPNASTSTQTLRTPTSADGVINGVINTSIKETSTQIYVNNIKNLQCQNTFTVGKNPQIASLAPYSFVSAYTTSFHGHCSLSLRNTSETFFNQLAPFISNSTTDTNQHKKITKSSGKMTLLKEKELFPGIYTSILRLPWSKRARNKSTLKLNVEKHNGGVGRAKFNSGISHVLGSKSNFLNEPIKVKKCDEQDDHHHTDSYKQTIHCSNTNTANCPEHRFSKMAPSNITLHSKLSIDKLTTTCHSVNVSPITSLLFAPTLSSVSVLRNLNQQNMNYASKNGRSPIHASFSPVGTDHKKPAANSSQEIILHGYVQTVSDNMVRFSDKHLSNDVYSTEKILSAQTDDVYSTENILSAQTDDVYSTEKILSDQTDDVYCTEKILSAQTDDVYSTENILSAQTDDVYSTEKILSAQTDEQFRTIDPSKMKGKFPKLVKDCQSSLIIRHTTTNTNEEIGMQSQHRIKNFSPSVKSRNFNRVSSDLRKACQNKRTIITGDDQSFVKGESLFPNSNVKLQFNEIANQLRKEISKSTSIDNNEKHRNMTNIHLMKKPRKRKLSDLIKPNDGCMYSSFRLPRVSSSYHCCTTSDNRIVKKAKYEAANKLFPKEITLKV